MSTEPTSSAAKPLHPVVGIDLGTTFSAVAAMNNANGEAEIISNPEDKKSTVPSVISMDHFRNRAIVGWAAKANRAINPFNTVIEVKRWMGDHMTPDALMQIDPQNEKKWRLRDEQYAGDPIQVKFNGEWFSPQAISAFTLMKMKEIAESAYGGREILDAVVTVPAYFMSKHRKATEEAALMAGLYPRLLIPEPTAAAICYGVDQYDDDQKVYLVYDLGGGTFDVSIIRVKGMDMEVIATSGDRRLGGADFDNSITKWAVDELSTKHGIDIRNDRRLVEIVKFHAEQLKIDLSLYPTADMPLPELRPENPPTLQLDRQRFQSLIDADLGKSLNYVDIAIRIAKTEKDLKQEIDAVLLVGGSSKIPYVKERLLDHFNRGDDFVRANLNPDTVVARGAAIRAKLFEPTPPPFDITRPIDKESTSAGGDDVPDPLSIVEHSLGIAATNELGEYKVTKLIPRGTNTPAERKSGPFTNPEMATHVVAEVYQGEGAYAIENDLIGRVEIGPLNPQPQGTHNFDVTFKIDKNGLLAVTVLHVESGRPFLSNCTSPCETGPKALQVLKERLHSMYFPENAMDIDTIDTISMESIEPIHPVTDAIAPVESPVSVAASSATSTDPITSQTPASAQAPPTQAASNQAASNQVDVTKPAAPHADIPAPHNGAASAPDPTGIITPLGEVPAEYKTIARKAERLLRKQRDPRLLRVFNEFTKALNSGGEAEELEDCASDLQSVYDKLLMSDVSDA